MIKQKALIHVFINFGLVIALSLNPLSIQQAQASYTYADTSTSTPLTGGELKVFENYMVWHSSDAKGDRQIFYQDLTSTVQEQITNVPSP